MDDLPTLPQRIAQDLMQRLRQFAPTSNLGVPNVEGLKDTPSTWRFINRHRAGTIDAACEILEAKIEYLRSLKQLRLAYEDYLDAELEAAMARDAKRMAHELMAKQHELQMVTYDAQIRQAKDGVASPNGASAPSMDALREKIRRAATRREKLNIANAHETADKDAVLAAGYSETGREMKEVEGQYAVLKSEIIRGEL